MVRILVVDDNEGMLNLYESALQSMGHDPVTKLSIDSGLETVREVGAQALVVDLQGPNEPAAGLRIIEELRADPQMAYFPIVLCSGAPDALDSIRPRLEALQVGVVAKPFKRCEAVIRSD